MARVVEVAGQSYEFPDDAPDEAVMAFVNKHAPKPATMLDVVRAIPSNVMNNMAKGTEGALSMLGDVGLAAQRYLGYPILWIKEGALPEYLMLVGGLLLP